MIMNDIYRYQISVSITNDSEMIKLNKEFKGKNITTDVLSFNIDQPLDSGEYYLGDVIVNKDQAKRQSEDYGNTFEQEIALLVQHGVLHLLGVHHEGDDH